MNAADKTIPIELSQAGYNAFYHHCEVYNGRSNYAVCLHTIDAVREKRVQLRSECPGAIDCGKCPAINMREQEIEAGKALFFEDRREVLERMREELAKPSEVVRYGSKNRVDQTSKLKTTKPTFVPGPVTPRQSAKTSNSGEYDVADIGTNMYQDAINNMSETNV